MKKNILLIALISVFVLASCAPGHNISAHVTSPEGSIAGFWLGLWHGIISPVTFVISLFNTRINIYEVHNNGGWYNFGFILGASIIFGGSGKASSRKKNKN
jgi:hypothetical protein